MKRLTFAMAALALAVVVVNPISAQVTLPENHYLTYSVAEQPYYSAHLKLRDQWMCWQGYQCMTLEKWQNPLREKNGEAVLYDDRVHHAWWRIQPIRRCAKQVLVEHQFGAYTITTGDAIFLLNPADKDDQIPEPDRWPTWANHYLCYKVLSGDALNVSLEMTDQWGGHGNTAREPYCFCNPVEKTTADGTVYPIRDARTHLTCYRLDSRHVCASFTYEDQFVHRTNVATGECLICLPSLKDETLPSEETSWGQIKALFGEE